MSGWSGGGESNGGRYSSDRTSGADLGLDEQGVIQGSRPKMWKVYEKK